MSQKIIAYGYDLTHTAGSPNWVVHPKCRNPFLIARRVGGIGPVWVSTYHGKVSERGHPLSGRRCAHCKGEFA